MEPPNKSDMSHVAIKFEMIARRIAQVVVILRSQAMQQSKRSNSIATRRAPGFADGLRCQAPNKGNSHLRRRLPCIPSRKTGGVTMWDLFRGSLP